MRHIYEILVLLPLGSDTIRNFRLRTPSHQKCFNIKYLIKDYKLFDCNLFTVFWQLEFNKIY